MILQCEQYKKSHNHHHIEHQTEQQSYISDNMLCSIRYQILDLNRRKLWIGLFTVSTVYLLIQSLAPLGVARYFGTVEYLNLRLTGPVFIPGSVSCCLSVCLWGSLEIIGNQIIGYSYFAPPMEYCVVNWDFPIGIVSDNI